MVLGLGSVLCAIGIRITWIYHLGNNQSDDSFQGDLNGRSYENKKRAIR
jgi:hypothetical protein